MVYRWLRWCEDEKRRRPTTMRDYRMTVRAYLLPAFGADTPIEEVADGMDRLSRLLANQAVPHQVSPNGAMSGATGRD